MHKLARGRASAFRGRPNALLPESVSGPLRECSPANQLQYAATAPSSSAHVQHFVFSLVCQLLALCN